MAANKEYCVIVAGGKGLRLPGVIPKQFVEVNGIPVLMHTLQAFFLYSSTIDVIVVLPESEIGFWKQLCQKHSFTHHHQIVAGGDTRFQSVKQGLNLIEGDGLVAIHDGVRPLVSTDTIGASFRLAATHDCAIATVRCKESLRLTDQQQTQAVDRSRYRIVQTPQTFRVSLIKQAYGRQEEPTFTDDAIVAELAGHHISLFEGSYENIKITTPEDLALAESLLITRRSMKR